MDFRFLENSLKKTAFSKRPFSVLDPAERDAFAFVMEILLLETGSSSARQYWQEQQLAALVAHAKKRSPFWRKRVRPAKPTLSNLKFLPVLTRKDLIEQVTSEGSLLTKADKIAVVESSSSGSSGTPVKFFSSAVNARYKNAREIAQEILEQHDFRENRIRIGFANVSESEGQDSYFKAVKSQGWLGPLANVFEHGITMRIQFMNAKDTLLKEFRATPPHHIICSPAVMDLLLDMGGIELLKSLGMKRWVPLSEGRSSEVNEYFNTAVVAISANYSSEETGPIAFECSKCPGVYHVAGSNVVVETDDTLTTEVDGETLSRVLITHLHSYATPLIRYDIGDFAKLSNSCECGHNGPTLSHIYGRAKRFIYFADGRYSPFRYRAKSILDRVKCTEFQIHQKDLNTIVVHIGGRVSLTENEEIELTKYIQLKTSADFVVDIRPVQEIDWRKNPKQLGFTSAFG